jgi:hypothetical protein
VEDDGVKIEIRLPEPDRHNSTTDNPDQFADSLDRLCAESRSLTAWTLGGRPPTDPYLAPSKGQPRIYKFSYRIKGCTKRRSENFADG